MKKIMVIVLALSAAVALWFHFGPTDSTVTTRSRLSASATRDGLRVVVRFNDTDLRPGDRVRGEATITNVGHRSIGWYGSSSCPFPGRLRITSDSFPGRGMKWSGTRASLKKKLLEQAEDSAFGQITDEAGELRACTADLAVLDLKPGESLSDNVSWIIRSSSSVPLPSQVRLEVSVTTGFFGASQKPIYLPKLQSRVTISAGIPARLVIGSSSRPAPGQVIDRIFQNVEMDRWISAHETALGDIPNANMGLYEELSMWKMYLAVSDGGSQKVATYNVRTGTISIDRA